jgi:threonylcarbamoyladenosine tRNA methylthiotransferase MtaB
MIWPENMKNSRKMVLPASNSLFEREMDSKVHSIKKVAVTTLGCKTNQFESAAISESVRNKGYLIVPFSEFADIYIINTCTVTAKSDAESRRLIRRARRQNALARIVVTGCYAHLAHDEIRHFPGVSHVLGNNEKKGIAELLEKFEDEQVVMVSGFTQDQQADGVTLETFAEHTRAFLQVQNGCDAYCSYCIVPYVRGPSRSVPLDDAVKGVRTFTGKGFNEVVLTGIHLGMYGLDLNPPASLLDLLSAIEQRSSVTRLRIGSLEPGEISDVLINFLSTSRICCPHLHIPLQSGDDQVLSRMNRHYTTRFYRDVIEKLLKAIPDICIGTDVIVGFPGESEREFENTRAYLESLSLAYFHVFPFSPREQTPAAKMQDRVRGSVIKERVKTLRNLSVEKKEIYFKKFLGKELDVLVQENMPGDSCKGLSRNYIPVNLNGTECSINSEVRARVRETGQDCVYCEVELGPNRKA